MFIANRGEKNAFHVVLIKPSHYDADGYVIQWRQSSIPANTLATIYALATDCAQRRILGDDVDIKVTAIDETNTRVQPKMILRHVDADDCLICLVGVQSNEFPRAMDIAKQFVDIGAKVCIGGFHVSGCIAMLPEIPEELQQAMDLGITLFAGEAEAGRFDEFLKTAAVGMLAPLYNFVKNLPNLDGAPVPYLPAENIALTAGCRASFDAGRGCPFLCSFCTIINVQGRKSRNRSADDIEHIVRVNAAQGVKNFFISDDNFARNRNWEVILDRIINLVENEKFEIYIIIQVDTMCHKIPRFVEKCGRAGVNRVFIGLENINPDALKTARKGQNRITEYRATFQAWHSIGALTYAGYIIGFPEDTPETIERDIKIIQRELPVDLMEFFILTPLPGSQDHKELYNAGAVLEPDLNKYDLEHVTTEHPLMSKTDIEKIYRKAWDIYYCDEHVERVILRSRKFGYHPKHMMVKLLSFYGCIRFEKVHPLQSGVFRRKYRLDRRPGYTIENPIIFYTKFIVGTIFKYARFIAMLLKYQLILRRAMQRPLTDLDRDIAMVPANDNDLDTLEMYQVTEAAKSSVIKVKIRKAAKQGNKSPVSSVVG